MEYLSRNLKTLKQEKIFHYHPMCSRLDITHLSFVDDLLLFVRGDATSVELMHVRFHTFSVTSGLKANLAKSSIYYGGVSLEVQQEIQQNLGYSQGSPPFRYLGITLDTKKLSVMQWEPLIDKIVARISSWTTNKLSYAAITKACWELTNKKDKLWIKWIHSDYIKDQIFANMEASKQASWMIRKLFGTKGNMDSISSSHGNQGTIIKQVYLKLLGELPKVTWKGLMYQNQERPKATFIMWVQLHGRLLTADRLKN
ncbi:PREDICTED: uncharacterized protein LOC109234884 [Nicotiana attenuata]|uniref:uncharacterized protein LOC109234884 n=1 Tax=Nicotiana attenuata TaxID=49451 RepID=UPI000904CD54|nr:PREDICTED: uncharacterized protein LOC109234884 [Nicotiana attenuata]